jgi:hypothetical protein
MKMKRCKRIIYGTLAWVMTLSMFTACGRSDDEYYYGPEDETGYEDNADTSYSEGENDADTENKGFDRENILPQKSAGGFETNPSNAEFYADELAYAQALETGSLDYLNWLSDYCVNVLEPQAVELLLRIPAIRQAADEELLSRYITLGLTYNDVNQFGAITMQTPLDKNGRSIDTDKPGHIRNIAHKVYINTFNFGPETQNDPAKKKELQDTLLHEMTHAVMADYTRNGGVGTFKDGSWADSIDSVNAYPDWFSEGCAITVQGGYQFTRDPMLECFMIANDDPKDERLQLLGSPETMSQSLGYLMDAYAQEDDDEDEGEPEPNKSGMPTDLTVSENQYVSTYYGTMFLYYLSAKSMGLEAFDESGIMDMEVMTKGMSNILNMLHDGYCLDQVVAEISVDPAMGVSLYKDLNAYEEAFLTSAQEPSMIFMQKMLYDLESRIDDPNEYIPCGSVIPGYNNYKKDFMDEDPHPVAEVYGIVCPRLDPSSDCFAVSTVRPSSVALTGGYHVSYSDDPGFSEDELTDIDSLYIGDDICLVDINQYDYYKSPDDWIRMDGANTVPYQSSEANGNEEYGYDETGYDEDDDSDYDELLNTGVTTRIPDLSSYGFTAGMTGASDPGDVPISLDLYESGEGDLFMLLKIGDNDAVFGIVDYEETTGRAGNGVKFSLSNGDFVILYESDEESGIVEDKDGNIYVVMSATEKEAREYANSLR